MNDFIAPENKRLPKSEWPFLAAPKLGEAKEVDTLKEKIDEIVNNRLYSLEELKEYFQHESPFVAGHAFTQYWSNKSLPTLDHGLIEQAQNRLKENKNILWDQFADAVSTKMWQSSFDTKREVKQFIHPIGAWIRDRANLEQTRLLFKVFTAPAFRRAIAANVVEMDDDLLDLIASERTCIRFLAENPNLTNKHARRLLNFAVKRFDGYRVSNPLPDLNAATTLWKYLGSRGWHMTQKDRERLLQKIEARENNYVRLMYPLIEDPGTTTGELRRLLNTGYPIADESLKDLINHPNASTEVLLRIYKADPYPDVRAEIANNPLTRSSKQLREAIFMDRAVTVQEAYLKTLPDSEVISYIEKLAEQAPVFAAGVIEKIELPCGVSVSEDVMKGLLSHSNRNIRVLMVQLVGRDFIQLEGETQPLSAKENPTPRTRK